MSQETIARLFNNPAHQGAMPDSDVTGLAGIPGERPYMQMQLRFAGDMNEAARFATYGCPYAVGCGNWVAGWEYNLHADVGNNPLSRIDPTALRWSIDPECDTNKRGNQGSPAGRTSLRQTARRQT